MVCRSHGITYVPDSMHHALYRLHQLAPCRQVKVDSFLVTNLHESAQRWFSHIDELEEHRQQTLRRKASVAHHFPLFQQTLWFCILVSEHVALPGSAAKQQAANH